MADYDVVLCSMASPPIMDEFIRVMGWGLDQIGHKSIVTNCEVDGNVLNIHFASMFLSKSDIERNCPRSIIFNLEQVGYPTLINNSNYFSLMRSFPTWDYSAHNREMLSDYGVGRIYHVPVGYCPELEVIDHSVEQDIDILFYGSLCPRRTRILESLKSAGLKVVHNGNHAYTAEERNGLIARSKIVLNMPFYDDVHVLEEVRISFLLNNRKCVVSEVTERSVIPQDLATACAFADEAGLVDLCLRLVANAAERNEIAEQGYVALQKRDWLPMLSEALATVTEDHSRGRNFSGVQCRLPEKINIGSGQRWRYDYLNIDIIDARGADLNLDISKPIDHEATFEFWRFGEWRIPLGGFNYVLAEHVLEHVHDLPVAMTNILNLLQEGGEVEIEVPYDLSHGAWQDPTHVRGFNERSWSYYGSHECWRWGWRDHCLEQISEILILEPLGTTMHDNGASREEMLRTPRAVCAMRVKLRKRSLSDAEKQAHAPYYRTIAV